MKSHLVKVNFYVGLVALSYVLGNGSTYAMDSFGQKVVRSTAALVMARSLNLLYLDNWQSHTPSSNNSWHTSNKQIFSVQNNIGPYYHQWKDFHTLGSISQLLCIDKRRLGSFTAYCDSVTDESNDSDALLSAPLLEKLIGIDNSSRNEEEEFDFERQCELWQQTVSKLKSTVKSVNPQPSLFISHAWHVNAFLTKSTSKQLKEDQYYKQLQEAQYLDNFCMGLFLTLRAAGFDVKFDENPTDLTGSIADLTTKQFMDKILDVDIVLAVCTETYHERSTAELTGVKYEIDLIKKRWKDSDENKKGFYIPLLVHGNDPSVLKENYKDKSYPKNCLLIGDNEDSSKIKIKDAEYIDLRHRYRFTANMWRVLHRLCSATIQKDWDGPKRQNYLHEYSNILEELIPFSTKKPLVSFPSSNEENFTILELEGLYSKLVYIIGKPKNKFIERLTKRVRSEDWDIKSFFELGLQAENGNILAQYNLAYLYFEGVDFIKQNYKETARYKEAARLWTLAAKQGFAPAQFNMGLMCEKGIGVDKNEKKAIEFFRSAAEQGNARAQTALKRLVGKQ